ncbi:MAG: family 20 glycosylhydrolase [Bacteroidetes bacterium]|nr:family 20 glycosylhydrolase [Bacteroidota bacterium]
MKSRLFLTIIVLQTALTGFGAIRSTPAEMPSLVPKPVSMKVLQGNFILKDSCLLLIPSGNAILKETGTLLAMQLKQAGGPGLRIMDADKSAKKLKGIILSVKEGSFPEEGYELKVTTENILITGGGPAGVFYGVQTLLQLLPPEIYSKEKTSPSVKWEVPCILVRDHPRYPYRGMHLDVSRHFFSVEFVKHYIDLIAMYKMNTFHWHLTDDNGWRIEIKKYPKLTSIGAWRVDRESLPWIERPPQKPEEKATYGGYYTQNEIREIVNYAKERFVTIIPEIEMPAHCLEVLAAYPQLSCTGGTFSVAPGSYWPNVEIFCAGNDSTFQFIEDVLSEVIDLFPSKYIHIGGDEADKTRWSACPKCQARMKAEGLKDEKELQSYFIKRIEKFLISKNKRLIGWDEILEGGLAPEATVMSWRGIEGGISAARQGHDVIMTPTGFCYFDYYQADPKFEPKAIGGSTTLKKVYSYDPTPGELTASQAKYILGAQGNLWTEYIPTNSQAEYMILPRMIALAEVVWTPKKGRNWNDFRHRLNGQFKKLDWMKAKYSKGSFKAGVQTFFDQKAGVLKTAISSEQPDIQIRYSLDGNDPTTKSPVYDKPFDVNRNCYLKAGLYVDDTLKESLTERSIIIHKATGKRLTYLKPYSYRYTGGGGEALVDGLRGVVNFHEGNWQGFLGNDMVVVIDMGKMTPIRSISLSFLHSPDSWIFMPDSVVYSLSSNGKKYHSINEERNDMPETLKGPSIKAFSETFPDTPARFIKIRAKNIGICPPWHEGKGEPCWLFADEIVVY